MAQTTIAGGFIDADLVSAQTALTAGLVSTDELIISDAGVLKRMDISVLEDYIVTNLGDNNIDVTQSSHGFAVGDVIRVTTTNNTYAKALADTAANAEVIGIVIDVTDTNNFTYATSGEITVAAAVPNSTTAGDIVYLSTSSAGGTQTTEPSTTNQISKPIAVITEANNKMVLLPYRGEIISGGATSFAPVDATYLTLGANGTLTGERVLTAGTGITLTDAGAGGAATLTIDNDSITFAKMQNVAANSVLIRNANSSGDLAELALATTQILIGNGTGFTAAALSGEATMTNAGVVSIADNIIDEANLKVSNAPTNGHVLTARSGNTGGFTWEAASGTTINNNADNLVITGSGSANTLEAEAKLTFNATNSQLKIDNTAGSANFDRNAAASTGQIVENWSRAGTAIWQWGIDSDGSSNQKASNSDFAWYNNTGSGVYKIVFSHATGGIGTAGGIATDGAVIPAGGILTGTNEKIGFGASVPNDTMIKAVFSSQSWVYNFTNNHGSGSNHVGQMNFGSFSPDSHNNIYIYGADTTTARFLIYSDGDIVNHDNSYGSTSDERIKQDIRDSNSQWDDIKAIRVRNFKKKEDVAQYGDRAWEQIGVIAQEVELVSPKLIREGVPTKFEMEQLGMGHEVENGENETKWVPNVDEDGNEVTVKGIGYSVLYMKAFKALQEAMARIETLETKVTALGG